MIVQGKQYKVFKEYWRNGEPHYRLKDVDTGLPASDRPAIFFIEVM